jgi:exodeoxyribonuclease III
MKIASWNVNSLKVRMPHLQQWLEDARPDIVALQETKLEDHVFPAAQLHEWGYRSVCSGQKTYNGVAVLAREEISAMHCDIPDFADPQKRVLAVTVGDVRIVNVYVVNGQAVGTEKFDYKLRWLAALTDWLRGEIAAHPKLVLLGDFNIAPDDSDVHDPEAWFEQVLCSTPEREAYQRILALGLHDSFRLREKGGGHFSWWDYRQGAFRRNNGLRIDLVLVSEALRERVTAVGLDRVPRTWDRPSDHIPAWAEFAP